MEKAAFLIDDRHEMLDGVDSYDSRRHERETARARASETTRAATETHDSKRHSSLSGPNYGIGRATTFPYGTVQGGERDIHSSQANCELHHYNNGHELQHKQSEDHRNAQQEARRCPRELSSMRYFLNEQDYARRARQALELQEQRGIREKVRPDNKGRESKSSHGRTRNPKPFPVSQIDRNRGIFDQPRTATPWYMAKDPTIYQTLSGDTVCGDGRPRQDRVSENTFTNVRRDILAGIRSLPMLIERRHFAFPSAHSPLCVHQSVQTSSQRPAFACTTARSQGELLVPRNEYYLSREATQTLTPHRATKPLSYYPSPTQSSATLSTESSAERGRVSSKGQDSECGSGGDIAIQDTASRAVNSAPQRKKKLRKARICTTDGCDKLVVDRGVCIRHGGGKRCSVEGCGCRAQNKGLCWKHGGYTICQVGDCGKRAKSRGMCWSHGGGTQCKTDGCAKIAVSRGHCWAHGGGKRCKLLDCQKPAALRMDDYCSEHYTASCANRLVISHDGSWM